MSVKLLTEHHLEFLSLKGGCTGSSESTLVKMPHCWLNYNTSANSKRKEMCHTEARNSIGLNRSHEQLTLWFMRFFYFLFMS